MSPPFFIGKGFPLSIQHKDIPDANLHEPKGVAAAVNKSVYKANGAGSGSWVKLNDSDMDYTDKTKNLFGWNDIADSQYTSGSPRSISASVRTLLTNNALATQTDTSRLGTIWNTGSSYFQVNDLNGLYIVRTQFKCKAAAAAGTPYVIKLELETSNGPTVISVNDQFIKGGSYENGVSFTTAIYLGSFINNTQLKVYLTPDTNVTVYDIGFVVSRTYKET